MSLPLNTAEDIPLTLAIRAHSGTSHFPERRGQQEIASYVAQLEMDAAIYLPEIERIAAGGNAEIPKAFALAWIQYREGYAKRTRDVLEAKSRCVSTLIAGPSNFNTSRARKASDSADRYRQAAEEFRVACLRELRRIVFPNEAPIASSDDNAIERLRAKLAEAEKFQTRAKEINDAIRKATRGGYNPITALIAIDVPAEEANKYVERDALGNIGVPKYKLTNNAAEIRRLKARIESVSAAKAAEVKTDHNAATMITVSIDRAANRVRLKFPGKPDAATRSDLKAHAFRWAPTIEGGVWQAYLNASSQAYAVTLASKGAHGYDGPTSDPKAAPDFATVEERVFAAMLADARRGVEPGCQGRECTEGDCVACAIVPDQVWIEWKTAVGR